MTSHREQVKVYKNKYKIGAWNRAVGNFSIQTLGIGVRTNEEKTQK